MIIEKLKTKLFWLTYEWYLVKLYRHWGTFREYSFYKKSKYCHYFIHVKKSRRMLNETLELYRAAKRDCWVVKKTGFGDFHTAIILKTNLWNLYQQMKHLHYHNEINE